MKKTVSRWVLIGLMAAGVVTMWAALLPRSSRTVFVSGAIVGAASMVFLALILLLIDCEEIT